jgi:hypothetical protein
VLLTLFSTREGGGGYAYGCGSRSCPSMCMCSQSVLWGAWDQCHGRDLHAHGGPGNASDTHICGGPANASDTCRGTSLHVMWSSSCNGHLWPSWLISAVTATSLCCSCERRRSACAPHPAVWLALLAPQAPMAVMVTLPILLGRMAWSLGTSSLHSLPSLPSLPWNLKSQGHCQRSWRPLSRESCSSPAAAALSQLCPCVHVPLTTLMTLMSLEQFHHQYITRVTSMLSGRRQSSAVPNQAESAGMLAPTCMIQRHMPCAGCVLLTQQSNRVSDSAPAQNMPSYIRIPSVYKLSRFHCAYGTKSS